MFEYFNIQKLHTLNLNNTYLRFNVPSVTSPNIWVVKHICRVDGDPPGLAVQSCIKIMFLIFLIPKTLTDGLDRNARWWCEDRRCIVHKELLAFTKIIIYNFTHVEETIREEEVTEKSNVSHDESLKFSVSLKTEDSLQRGAERCHLYSRREGTGIT